MIVFIAELGDEMVKKKRNYSAEFRRETAELVLDNGYLHHKAADAMGVGYSTVGNGSAS